MAACVDVHNHVDPYTLSIDRLSAMFHTLIPEVAFSDWAINEGLNIESKVVETKNPVQKQSSIVGKGVHTVNTTIEQAKDKIEMSLTQKQREEHNQKIIDDFKMRIAKGEKIPGITILEKKTA